MPKQPKVARAVHANSGYMGLDTTVELVPPVPPVDESDPAQDAGFEEGKHPRADNGQFGSGGGGGPSNESAPTKILSGKALEQEVAKQITEGWQKSIGGSSFTVGKQYPVTVDVNGRKMQFAASKKTGSGPLTLEMLVETKIGPMFQQFKLGKGGALVDAGSRNLFAHTEESKNAQIDDYRALFNATRP